MPQGLQVRRRLIRLARHRLHFNRRREAVMVRESITPPTSLRAGTSATPIASLWACHTGVGLCRDRRWEGCFNRKGREERRENKRGREDGKEDDSSRQPDTEIVPVRNNPVWDFFFVLRVLGALCGQKKGSQPRMSRIDTNPTNCPIRGSRAIRG